MWMYPPVACCCCCCWVGGSNLEHIKQIQPGSWVSSLCFKDRLTLKSNEQNWTSGSLSEAGAACRNAVQADRKQAHHEPEPWPLKSWRAAVSVCLSFSPTRCVCVCVFDVAVQRLHKKQLLSRMPLWPLSLTENVCLHDQIYSKTLN